eukprot:COSAG06_NODE_1041_length_10982_cov_6.205366_1_plen_30_part_10
MGSEQHVLLGTAWHGCWALGTAWQPHGVVV